MAPRLRIGEQGGLFVAPVLTAVKLCLDSSRVCQRGTFSDDLWGRPGQLHVGGLATVAL